MKGHRQCSSVSDTLGETEVLLTQYEACQAGKENPLGFQEQWGEKHY